WDEHSTEIKIDALPKGMYVLIVSKNENFSINNNILNFSPFQVSRLSLFNLIEQGKAYTLDRKTGAVIPNVQVDVYVQQYDRNSKEYYFSKEKATHSDNNGTYNLFNERNHNSFIKLTKADDELLTSSGYYYGNHTYQDKKTEQRFFFTDRAIYRPGQT